MHSTSSHIREKVWYKLIRKQKERKDKIESEWHEGLWLGQSRSTNETIVVTAEGVVRACTTRREDADERWKGDLIKKPQGTPARPDPSWVQLMVPIRVRFDPPQVGEPDPTMQPRKEPQMRRMKITESMLQKYGYTEGCEGRRAPPWRSLSVTSREQALDGDEAGRELRRKNTERENQRIAEKIERDLRKTGDEPMAQEPEEAPEVARRRRCRRRKPQ